MHCVLRSALAGHSAVWTSLARFAEAQVLQFTTAGYMGWRLMYGSLVTELPRPCVAPDCSYLYILSSTECKLH